MCTTFIIRIEDRMDEHLTHTTQSGGGDGRVNESSRYRPRFQVYQSFTQIQPQASPEAFP